jgi:hypothetical protein
LSHWSYFIDCTTILTHHGSIYHVPISIASLELHLWWYLLICLMLPPQCHLTIVTILFSKSHHSLSTTVVTFINDHNFPPHICICNGTEIFASQIFVYMAPCNMSYIIYLYECTITFTSQYKNFMTTLSLVTPNTYILHATTIPPHS